MTFDWPLLVLLVAASAAAALFGMGLLSLIARRSDGRSVPLLDVTSKGTLFIFDGETLVDATPSARSLISGSSLRGSPWQRLMSFLVRHFPDIEARLRTLPNQGRVTMESGKGGAEAPLAVTAEWRAGLMRINLTDPDVDRAAVADPITQRATADELELLRSTVTLTPHPVWVENAAGEVIWSNGSYLALALQGGEDLSWPLPKVFRIEKEKLQRVRVLLSGKAPQWFEVVTSPLDGGQMVFAQPIDALVQAEGTLREFTQTLTKTFASLPIGLAIFNRQRKLALFNPALSDLTGLNPAFLTGQPSLFDFLDRLRDGQMIPEPKDFAAWRKRLVDLEKASAIGQFDEQWSLPGGQVYRVTGRPHPEGALALLFEDITLQMSRSRRDRANAELGQAVIDSVSDGVAVFAAGGELVMTNAAYARIWNHDPMAAVSGPRWDVGDLAAHWRSLSASSPSWAEIEALIRGQTPPAAEGWSMRRRDGRAIDCRARSLTGGATMIEFRLAGRTEPELTEEFGAPIPFVSQRHSGRS